MASEGSPPPPVEANREETFGTRLKRLRKERRISLIGMARLLNVTKPTVWKWETDKARPRPETLEALASILEVSERALLLGGGDDSAPPQLSELIKDCKGQIAELAGTSADNVSITIHV